MDADGPLAFSANDLYFREWRDADVEHMAGLFDTDEMNRWTPLPFPFTPEVAAGYVCQWPTRGPRWWPAKVTHLA